MRERLGYVELRLFYLFSIQLLLIMTTQRVKWCCNYFSDCEWDSEIASDSNNVMVMNMYWT